MSDPDAPKSTSIVPEKCRGLCTGDAWWVFNMLCCPFVLLYNSIVVYLLPCVFVLLHRLVRTAFCTPVKLLCPGFYNFTDKKFPHTSTAVLDPRDPPKDTQNEFYAMDTTHIDGKIDWVRAENIYKATAPKPTKSVG